MISRLILMFCCACYFPLEAQERFESHTKKDGLTSSEVTVTLLDSKGVVWIGTTNGLTAYSGSTWYAIKNVTDNESGKPKAFGSIKVLFEDSKRNLWVGSSKGLFLFDGKSWTSFKKEEDESHFSPKLFMEDRQGRIWIEYEYIQHINATAQLNYMLTNGMLHMYNAGRWINFNGIIGGTSVIDPGYPSDYFSSLFQDRTGNVWVGTQEGAFMFDGKVWNTYKEEELKSEKVMCILNNRRGDIWVATDYGISLYIENKWLNYKKKHGLNGNNIYHLVEDNQERIWAFVRTNQKFAGLAMFEKEIWHPYSKNDIKLKGTIESLTIKQDEVIAFAKDGLAVFRDNTWYKYGKKDGLTDKAYLMISKNRFGIWLVGETALYKLQGDKWELLYQNNDKWDVNVMFVENRERIWLGTEKNGVYLFSENNWKHYTENSGLADDRITDIFKDKKGRVWIVSKSGVTRVLND